MVFVLDTDHISSFQRNHQPLLQRLNCIESSELSITVISVVEILEGCLSKIKQEITKIKGKKNRLESGSSIDKYYALLISSIEFFSKIRVLDFGAGASRKHQEIKGLNIGDQDLRIAAIVLSVDGILLTRNKRHFGKVPGLKFEDWTL